jgi:hypothetical protein
MEHRCDVKKLWIGRDPKTLTVQHPEQIRSPGVVV